MDSVAVHSPQSLSVLGYNILKIEMETRHLAWLLFISLLIGTASSQGSGVPGIFQAGQGLTGHVVDASGNGISGVNVWMIPIIPVEGIATNTTTNSTGYYSFDLPPGNYTIMAELPGYSFTASEASVQTGIASVAQEITGYPAAGNAPGITGAPAGATAATSPQYVQFAPAPVQFAPGVTGWAAGGGVGWVQGRMMDQSGTGIPYASITVDGFQAGATDEQGNYMLALSPGMHRIGAMRSGYGIPPRVVFVNAGQTTSFNLIGKSTVSLGIRR